jgi:hypothetical protein
MLLAALCISETPLTLEEKDELLVSENKTKYWAQ